MSKFDDFRKAVHDVANVSFTCISQSKDGNGYIEKWMAVVNGRVIIFIVTIFSDGGYDLFLQSLGNTIEMDVCQFINRSIGD